MTNDEEILSEYLSEKLDCTIDISIPTSIGHNVDLATLDILNLMMRSRQDEARRMEFDALKLADFVFKRFKEGASLDKVKEEIVNGGIKI